MNITREKIRGLWGEKYYTVKERSGLILWSNAITQLAKVITEVDEKGRLYLSSENVEQALEIFPRLAILALSTDIQFTVIDGLPWTTFKELEEDGRKTRINQIREAIESTGFAVLDAPASRYVSWVAIPNTDRGGH